MNKQSVCPWQAGSILTSTIRKWFHDPLRIIEPYLSVGMTAMDIGCGVGFFTIPMSGIVGEQGKVIAIDLQRGMLDGLEKIAVHAGTDNITAHLCESNSLRVGQWNHTVDFALVFYMLHEVPDEERLIKELYSALTPNGMILFVEPVFHVSKQKYQQSLNMICRLGFEVLDTPIIPVSRAATIRKTT